MTFNEISVALLDMDSSELKAIQEVLDTCKSIKKSKMMRTLSPGDVVIVDNIRPKAICGLKATVRKVNRTTISVDFGADAGRHSGPCKVPSSCCTVV